MLMKTKCIYLVLFVLLVSGCGATSNVIQKYQPDKTYKLNYYLSAAPQVEVPDEVLKTMQNQIQKNLSEQNLLTSEVDNKFHKADILITHYRMRHDAARLLVGIMAGCDKINSKVTILDSDTKKIVGEAEFESNECAAWGIASQVVKAHVDKIANYLSGK